MLKYDEFIERVNDAGFWTPFTNYIDQEIFMFSCNSKNVKGQAYLNDPETDTEMWKHRVLKECKLACGHFFNGKSGGYIAPHFYTIFIDAFRPRMDMKERYEDGKLGEYEIKIWNFLFKSNEPQGFDSIRKHFGFKGSKDLPKTRKLESALKNLQMTFDISLCYIATGVGYSTVDNWIPPEWLNINKRMEHEEALEIIYHQAERISNIGEAKRAFSQSLKLYKM